MSWTPEREAAVRARLGAYLHHGNDLADRPCAADLAAALDELERRAERIRELEARVRAPSTSARAERAAAVVRAHPGRTTAQLATILGCGAQTAARAAREAGLIHRKSRRGDRREKHWYPPEIE